MVYFRTDLFDSRGQSDLLIRIHRRDSNSSTAWAIGTEISTDI